MNTRPAKDAAIEQFNTALRARAHVSHFTLVRTGGKKIPSYNPLMRRKKKRWIAGVTTVSTYPPPGLFTRSAATIARTLASKEVSPKGPTSGLRMLTYFINRGGRNLSASRRVHREREKSKG
ncbi:MAG: DUF3175 domain-containing protein [Acidobacteriia bacterium]|nr:DUF3175 domain-containing protein [Terriglobia bacterium]